MKKFLIIIIIVLIALGSYIIWKNKTSQDSSNLLNNNIENNKQNTTPSPSTQINENEKISKQTKSIFNSNFDVYYGKNVSAKKIKALIASVEYSNSNSTIGTVDLFINGEQTTNLEKVIASSTYSVDFEYNEDGLIYKVIVKENVD